jgi:hypothetical protein
MSPDAAPARAALAAFCHMAVIWLLLSGPGHELQYICTILFVKTEMLRAGRRCHGPPALPGSASRQAARQFRDVTAAQAALTRLDS